MSNSIKATSNKATSNKKPAASKAPKIEVITTSFAENLVSALIARNAEAPSKDIDSALHNVRKGYAALNLVAASAAFAEVLPALVSAARVADNKVNKSAYIAVKVLVKIVKTLEAIGQGRSAVLDPYTRTIAANLCKLNSISNKSNMVCLSKSVAYSEFDQVATLKHRYDCSANTADTQASSTRMTFNYLQVCDVLKGKKGDVMSLRDNARARALVALFGEREITDAVTAQ